MVGRTAGGGLRREFTADQAERVRANLSFDGQELRACRDAVAAIDGVVQAQRLCSAVDLSAIRSGAAEL